jgi:hypothetical protein
MRHVRLKQPDKSAVAEHNFNTGHRIDFSSTSVLDKATGYMDRIVKEELQNPEDMDRDGPRNVGLFMFKPLDVASSPRRFYYNINFLSEKRS